MNIIEPKKQFIGGIRPFSNASLRAMIIPLLIEQLLQVVVGLADTLMVSYAGEATVSGVSLDTMIYTIFIYLFTAVATGGAVVVLFLPVILPLYDVTAETKRLVFLIVVIHNLFAGIVQPFSMPLAAGLRAAGDVRFAMYSAIFCTVVLRTALSFLLALWLHMDVIGIALAMGIDWTVKAAMDLLRYRGGKWRSLKVI